MVWGCPIYETLKVAMLKYFFFTLIIVLTSCSHPLIKQWSITEDDLSIKTFPVPHGFDVFYDSWAAKSIKEYYISWSIVLNGSYFGVTDFGAYYPAGLWEWENIICCWLYLQNPHGTGANISTVPDYSDPNLSHIVGVSLSWWVNIFPRSELKRNAWPYKNAFQAWPLVLSGNILQTFWDSWHANWQHERTLLGVTKNWLVYLFVSIDEVSLSEVGQKILELAEFRDDPITVINLDGGPSTAYYDGRNWFRENVKLPIIFRIKP